MEFATIVTGVIAPKTVEVAESMSRACSAAAKVGAAQVQTAGKSLVTAIRGNRKLAVAAGIAAGTVVAAGSAAIALTVHRRRAQERSLEATERFDDAFDGYLDALWSGEVSADVIDDLEEAIFDQHTLAERVLERVAENIAAVEEYTRGLAKTNGFKAEGLIDRLRRKRKSELENFLNHLATQRQIIEMGNAGADKPIEDACEA